MKCACYLDRFSSGLDELTRRQQSDVCEVLQVLDRTKRYSVFEATANETIAKTMDRVIADGMITTDTLSWYPWTNCELTEKGKAMIAKMQACLDCCEPAEPDKERCAECQAKRDKVREYNPATASVYRPRPTAKTSEGPVRRAGRGTT